MKPSLGAVVFNTDPEDEFVPASIIQVRRLDVEVDLGGYTLAVPKVNLKWSATLKAFKLTQIPLLDFQCRVKLPGIRACYNVRAASAGAAKNVAAGKLAVRQNVAIRDIYQWLRMHKTDIQVQLKETP